jgi:ubiquinone/menaquinone biosynthesis C-methylase UbiE
MRSFFRQFAHPEGPLGWFVGHLMALKNGARSRFALELLGARRGEHVLELGFGPGVDVARLWEHVGPNGRVAGADVSQEMVRHARRRNRRAVASGGVDLRCAAATELPFDDASFDAVYAANSAQFWRDLDAGFAEVRRVLRPGGRAVVAVQPMWKGATPDDARDWATRLQRSMDRTGFVDITSAERDLRPVLAVAARGSVAPR